MSIMKMIGKHNKAQQGYIMALSMVIMGFGSLVVASMLTYVTASVSLRTAARDNMNAYYAADAGIQLVIAKLVQADYTDPDSGSPGPLPPRFDDGDGVMEGPPSSDYEYYWPSGMNNPDDPSPLFPGVTLSDQIDGYWIRMTVKQLNMELPEYADYEVTAYAFSADPTQPTGPKKFGEAKEWVTATVRQSPYPAWEVWNYGVTILSWQRR